MPFIARYATYESRQQCEGIAQAMNPACHASLVIVKIAEAAGEFPPAPCVGNIKKGV